MSNPWGPPEGERGSEPPPSTGPRPPFSPPPAYPYTPRPETPFAQPPPQTSAYGGTPTGAPSYGVPAYRQPPGAYGFPGPGPGPLAPVPETATNAVAAIVCAALAWTFCPVILAIVALVLASNADREIAASGGTKTGDGLTKAARIISWVNIAVFGAMLLVSILGLILFAAAGL